MLTIPVFNQAGEKVGEESIDPADFGGEVNKQLLHDVVLMHQANRRVGTVNTRGRADVAGSGKKLFRQKGTGNARVGAKRTNKRKGGGVAFARRNRDYRYAMPKRAVRAAIRMALLSKFQDGQALIVEGVGGESYLLKAEAIDGPTRSRLEAARLQAVEEEYQEFLSECSKLRQEIRKEIRIKKFTRAELAEEEHSFERLERWAADLAGGDLFGAPSRSLAEQALKECGAALEDFAARVLAAEERS